MVSHNKRKRSRQIMIDDEMWTAVEAVADAEGVSRAEIVRRGLAHEIEEAKRNSDDLSNHSDEEKSA